MGKLSGSNVILIAMKRHQQRQSRWHINVSPRTRRIIIFSACIIAGIFVLGNIALWAIYHNRTYPRTQLLGTTIGNTPYGELAQKATDLKLLPKTLELTYQDKKVHVPLSELGIRSEGARTSASANQQRSWLPVFNLLKAPVLKAPVAADSRTLDAKAKELAGTFYKEPANARLKLESTTISIIAEQKGYSLDQNNLQTSIFQSLDDHLGSVKIPVKSSIAKVKASDLKDDQQTLQDQIKTIITFRYNGQSKPTTAEQVAQWFIPSGETYALSPDNIRAYISSTGTSFGIRVKDISQVTTAVNTAVTNKKSTDITLTAQLAAKTYEYCVAAKNVPTSHLPVLRAKLASAFSDSRGWSLAGQVAYQEVGAGCDFTVWLSAAADMPSFGEICDSTWSCRVGPNVVINFDRWMGASPAWNANGGTLDEYRFMVINHETGHWLGFGHSHCPGTGAAAPVMQQQSIDLQGCTFNAWPTASELGTLRNRLGL
jgi:hypothetical protein